MGVTLISLASGSTLQWLDCNNGFAPLPGFTTNTFIAPANGSYAVAVTKLGCTDSSICHTVTGVGISEITDNDYFNVTPNPATSHITIDLKNITKEAEMKISDYEGKIVYSSTSFNKRKIEISMDNFMSGIYFLQVRCEHFTGIKKLIVEK
jgi:hypothetical protein